MNSHCRQDTGVQSVFMEKHNTHKKGLSTSSFFFFLSQPSGPQPLPFNHGLCCFTAPHSKQKNCFSKVWVQRTTKTIQISLILFIPSPTWIFHVLGPSMWYGSEVDNIMGCLSGMTLSPSCVLALMSTLGEVWIFGIQDL